MLQRKCVVIGQCDVTGLAFCRKHQCLSSGGDPHDFQKVAKALEFNYFPCFIC